jgi:hypothetical protein
LIDVHINTCVCEYVCFCFTSLLYITRSLGPRYTPSQVLVLQEEKRAMEEAAEAQGRKYRCVCVCACVCVLDRASLSIEKYMFSHAPHTTAHSHTATWSSVHEPQCELYTLRARYAHVCVCVCVCMHLYVMSVCLCLCMFMFSHSHFQLPGGTWAGIAQRQAHTENRRNAGICVNTLTVCVCECV